MSKHPQAARADHDDFCTTENWALVRGATGKPVARHRTYELALPDGRILRTRISRPVDRTQYRDSVWSHILRTQLQVTADEFWECVTDEVLPQRSRSTTPRGSRCRSTLSKDFPNVGFLHRRSARWPRRRPRSSSTGSGTNRTDNPYAAPEND